MSVKKISSEQRREVPQFSLRSLLLIAAGVAVYVTIAMAVVRHHGKLLDVVTDWAGISAFGCGFLAVAGLGIMVASIALGRSGHFWPIVVLLAALLYAPANAVLFMIALLMDRTAVFDDFYLFSTVLLGPAVMLIAIVIFAGFFRRIGWLSVLGFTVWIECISFAHLWIIAAASASI